MNKGLIIALDFDGTVVTHKYPEIGKDIGAVPVLKRLADTGCLFVLNSMRSKKNGTLDDAVNWFKKNNIELYGVNKEPNQEKWTDSSKTYAHIYIDDAAFGCPVKYDDNGRKYVDWNKIERMFEEKGIL